MVTLFVISGKLSIPALRSVIVRGQALNPGWRERVAVRRYSVAACWSLIWVTFLACRRTLRVPRGALRSIWAILSGRAPPATLVIRGCLRCRVDADRPTGAAPGG